MQDMIKKDAVYSWGKRENNALTHIKKTIAEAPGLYNLYFNNDFLLYTFASDNSLAIIFTQKDELNAKRPISFISASMQGT